MVKWLFKEHKNLTQKQSTSCLKILNRAKKANIQITFHEFVRCCRKIIEWFNCKMLYCLPLVQTHHYIGEEYEIKSVKVLPDFLEYLKI